MCSAKETFNEELLIETLPNSNVHFHFQFTTVAEKSPDQISFNHYNTFPKQIGDLISKFEINELHLSLTQGLWKTNLWGEATESVPPGGELWIWFNDVANTSQIESLWPQATRSLSGLFCASLNFINNEISVQPKHSYRPQGLLFFDKTSPSSKSELNKRLKYASLPSEIVCTENLTPWAKMLPCGKYKGLAKLFTSATKLFDTKYHSMGVHVRHICLDDKCERVAIEFKQTLSLVFDLEMGMRRSSSDYIRWTFESLFSANLDSVCPSADKSLIYVDLNHLNTGELHELEPTPSKVITLNKIYNNRKMHVYDLKTIFANDPNTKFNLYVGYEKKSVFKFNQKYSLLNMHRYLTDTNQFNLGFETLITNTNENSDVRVVYFEAIPWYFRVYLSTLKIKDTHSGELVKPDSIHYVPALDRQRPHHIEIVFDIKANRSVRLSLSFQNAFLKWTEFPPDAQHGHYMNSAVLSYKFKQNDPHLKASTHLQYREFHNYSSIYESLQADHFQDERLVRLYSEVLLINLPTPDFSMPYNVICLSCTAIAIAFGSLHNFTTRKFVFKENKGFLTKLKEKFFKKKSSTTNATTNEEKSQ